MRSYFSLSKTSLLVLPAILFIISCNNGSDEKTTDKKDTTTKNVTVENLPTAGLTGGTLDTLITDSASFAELPDKKIVFVVTFRQNDTMTFHGWAAEKDSIFGPNPDIKLIEYSASTLSYNTGMYFGNVVLKKGEVNKIKGLLQSQHAHTVLFAPKLVNGNHIGYDIFLSTQTVSITGKITNVLATGFDANPSPPKNY